MKKIIVPEDLKKIGRNKIIGRIVAFEILFVASVLILYFADDWFNTVSIENKIITYIFFLALPFVLSGFPHKLIDKTWSGTVVKAEIRRVLCRDYNYKYWYGKKWKPVVDVLKDKDDFVTETTTNVNLKENGDLDMYSKGDKVIHVYGCEYLYVIPKKQRTPLYVLYAE